MGSLGDHTAVAIVLCTGSQEDWARRLDEGVVHAEAVHSLHPSRPHVCQDAAPASTFAYPQILAGGLLEFCHVHHPTATLWGRLRFHRTPRS